MTGNAIINNKHLTIPFFFCHANDYLSSMKAKETRLWAVVKMIYDRPVLMLPWPRSREEGIDLAFTTS